MLRLALVNMPFSSASLPSIALTQLKSVIQTVHGDRVETQIFYLNHDVARYFGSSLYELVADRVEAVTSGLGDWLFRDLAFPAVPDNTEAYFRRHFVEVQKEHPQIIARLLEKRRGLGAVLDELIDRYELDSYDVVGLTSMFSQSVACFALARALKQLRPEIVTVMGGANCESSMGRVIARNVAAIDYVFSGPALQSFADFVGHRLAGDPAACGRLAGVYSQHSPTPSPSTGLHDMAPELDIDVDVPLDYDDFLESIDSKLDGSVEPEILFETSRGCWWGERAHCTFCGLNGVTMKYRAMRADKAIALVQGLIDRYSERVSRFQSVDNILPRQYLTDVLPHLSSPDHVSIFYEVKADLKDREMAVLARARVTQIQPGIEALASSTLALMKKGTTSFQNLKFLKACLKYDIRPNWNLLIGFPGEGEEVYEKYVDDMPWMTHFPPPNGIYPIRFDRFSPYFNQASQYGLKLLPCDFYGMVYPFDPADLPDLAYFFVDDNPQAPYRANTAKWFGRLRERLARWHELWSEDLAGRPTLDLRGFGDARTILDSRDGKSVEHRLSPEELAVLEALGSQRRVEQLQAQLPGIPAATIDAALAEFVRLGLVFCEGDLFLGLVVDDEEPASLPAPRVSTQAAAPAL